MTEFNNQIGVHINDIENMRKIEEYALENVFKVYSNNGYFFFNIGKKINIPFDLDEDLFFNVTYNEQLLTTLSNKYYGTPSLWWMILYANGIYNPFDMPENGSTLRILTPTAVRFILDRIQLEMSQTN